MEDPNLMSLIPGGKGAYHIFKTGYPLSRVGEPGGILVVARSNLLTLSLYQDHAFFPF